MLLKWLWCGMIGWYPPLNDSSDLTWHMFTIFMFELWHHSLHAIYVHGGLYPTHACTRCWLILMHDHDCCCSLSWSLPSLLLAFTCTKWEYCLCIQIPWTKFISWVSTKSTYMRYLRAVPSKFVHAKLQTFKWNSVLYARAAHVSTRVVCIFHARWVILTRSGLRSSLMRKGR